MAQQYKVTSVGVNPAKDRAYRMRMYFIAMSLRVACIVSLFWVRGPWIILVAAGAIILPYFAVLIANAVSNVGGQAHEAPAPLAVTSNAQTLGPDSTETPPSQTVIVVDAPAERRARGTQQGDDLEHRSEGNSEHDDVPHREQGSEDAA